MFKLIFLKELKEILQSSRFTISFVVCSVLIIVSFFMGAQNYLASQSQYEAAVQENLNQIGANTDWSMINHSIMLPPQPLMALVNGISNDIGRSIEMGTRGELRPDNTRFNDEPLFAIFRFMDLEFIFTIVLSLFAVIFAYDAINGEKNAGTLKLCFSNSVSRASFIAGKLAGSFTALTIALIIPLLIGSLILPVLGVHLTTDEWMRLGLIILSGLAYFSLFLAMAISVSAMTTQTSSSFLIALVVWIFAVLIIPRGSVLVSGRLVEVPNVDEMTAQKNSYRFQLFDEDRPKMADFRVPQDTPMDEIMGAFSNMMSDLSKERQDKIEALEERLNENYQNKKREQASLALNLSRISPTSVFTLTSSRLAGTSLELQNRYLDAAKSYQKVYADFIKEKTGNEGHSGFRMVMVSDDEMEEEETIDISELPRFEYKSASFANTSKDSILDIGLLALFNLLFFGGAFMAFLKYDLR